jgi:hypothetical protein
VRHRASAPAHGIMAVSGNANEGKIDSEEFRVVKRRVKGLEDTTLKLTLDVDELKTGQHEAAMAREAIESSIRVMNATNVAGIKGFNRRLDEHLSNEEAEKRETLEKELKRSEAQAGRLALILKAISGIIVAALTTAGAYLMFRAKAG